MQLDPISAIVIEGSWFCIPQGAEGAQIQGYIKLDFSDSTLRLFASNGYIAQESITKLVLVTNNLGSRQFL
jgi:hypothetical protein